MADVLVICEVKDGKLKKSSREALTIGRQLAAAAGGSLNAFACGSSAAAAAAEAGSFGVATLHVAGDAALDAYASEHWTSAAKFAVEASSAAIVVMSATSAGRDLAPRLGARLGAGVASDVVALEWADGKLRARRPVYSGKAFATVEIGSNPAIATCRANAFPAEATGAGACEVSNLAWSAGDTKAKLVAVNVPETTEVSLADADVVVSGGRGLKETANYAMIHDLAHALGGATGASRAIVDDGWVDHHHQVGQTGRVVSPNLYIAIGISGAIQHLAGMSSSKHIVAINKDGEAPIFRVADLGVVGDLFQILPPLIEEIKKAKAH
ncbi:MAG: electron transfer flavoprotein subunit alpha/FixB family protein [Acidobacteria bacterium]|nr:electron transfer flavoprotein subunit alpha/FixB family protein [Acidobacteriota bacterium]